MQLSTAPAPVIQAVVDIAKARVGNVGGEPYWRWFGFTSRVEWCACFVSWCYGQMGCPNHAFQRVRRRASRGFQSHGQWGGPDYSALPPATPSFSTGTLTVEPTMSASLSARMVAGSTPWRAIPATPAKSEAIFDLRVHQGLWPDELVRLIFEKRSD